MLLLLFGGRAGARECVCVSGRRSSSSVPRSRSTLSPKNGYLTPSIVEMYSSPLRSRVVLSTRYHSARSGHRWKCCGGTPYMWFSNAMLYSALASFSRSSSGMPPNRRESLAASATKSRLAGWPTLSVSTSRSLRETLLERICSSWCPKHVPQIGKGSPASLDATAMLNSLRAAIT